MLTVLVNPLSLLIIITKYNLTQFSLQFQRKLRPISKNIKENVQCCYIECTWFYFSMKGCIVINTVKAAYSLLNLIEVLNDIKLREVVEIV